ncbi:FxSxx-COOH system tetratricopeptide repeat protein [Nonomuraea sp. NPDC049750]|uniref:FxSxx-COOH system tetratricopeptide repeat protein n=1 Tax=Nonomuraea sp. NPDC049750 TaxID=3154738 RepID=UPI0033E7EB4D
MPEESLQAFIAALGELRGRAGGPSYRELRRLNPERLAPSTVQSLLEGERKRTPSWPLVDAFVRACLAFGRENGLRLEDDEEAYVRGWLDRHRSVSASMSQAAEPAPDDRDDSLPRILGGGTPPVRGHFSGRRRLLAELGTAMAAQTGWPVCLVGPGGHGKTQLASEYIHQHSSRYVTVWWVRAEQPSLIRTDLASLGHRLDEGIGEAAIVSETLKLLREDPRWAPWLLVFDNAGHPATMGAFLPRGGSGHVLITSREPAWDEVAVPIDVGVFERGDSIELLTRRVPGISVDEAGQVAEELADMPLGVVQAGTYIKGSGLAPGAYLARLREQPGRMLDQHPPVDYGRGLASAWDLGFETLAQTCPEALHLLRRCAFLRPESISRGLLRQGRLALSGESVAVFQDPVLADNAIRALTRYGFVRLAGQGTIQVHRLLQSTVKERMAGEERERVRRDVHRLLAGFDCGDPDNRANFPRYAELAGHAEASSLADSTDEEVRGFVTRLVAYFRAINDGEGAERYSGVALEAGARTTVHDSTVARPAPAPAVPRRALLAQEMEGDDWARLIYQVTTGDCTPIVGADVSREKAARVRAMSWEWAGRLGYPFADAWDFESVLDYAVTLPDQAAMAEEILDGLRREWERQDEEDPHAEDPYAFLAKMPATSYLTTGYHGRLARSLLGAGREPVIKVLPWRPERAAAEPVVAPTPERPLVCHLAGSYDLPGSLVLSESDRLRCLRVEYDQWSPDILGALVTYPFLMIGFNPRSSSFDLLMSLLSGVPSPKRNIMALYDPGPGGMEEAARRYHLARIARLNIRAAVFWGDARDFIQELSRRLETTA